MSGNRKAKHDVAPLMRVNFVKAVTEVARRQERPIHEIMADWLEADPYKMLQAIAKFSVRENRVEGKVAHQHDHSHKHTGLQETSVWLAETLGAGAEGSPEEPVSH